MKNLKKVLALGLALVMLLGMFTIASAAEATALTDWADVEHKDAVSLMVDLGIIKGMPDGSYAPAEGIDRASWAKMVYYAATGSDDADAYLGTATALKDISGNWAEAYISYLAAVGTISGDTNGNYNPSNKVSVAEAAKMLLTTLGWDAEDRGYQNNAAWSGNIMTDAKKQGIMDDVAQTALQTLTRDNAAQMILNALNATVMEPVKGRDNGEKYVTSYTNTGKTLGLNSFDMAKKELTVTGINADGTAVFAAGDGLGTTLSGKVKATLADVGKTVNVYVKVNSTGAFKSLISSSVAAATATPVKTITEGVKFSEKAATLWVKGDDYIGFPKASSVDFYINGVDKSSDFPADVSAGDVVELYANTDGEIDIIKVTHYDVAKVGDIKTKTVDDVEKVLITNVTGGKYVPKDQITGLADIAKDDIVLYCVNSATNTMPSNGDDAVLTVEKLSPVSGKVTSVSSKSKITVGGTEYAISSLTSTDVSEGDTATFSSWGNFDDEFALYLDKNSDVCWIIKLTDESVGSDVAVVLDATWVAGSGLKGSNYMEAELLFTDGTTEVVTVSKLGKWDAATSKVKLAKTVEGDAATIKGYAVGGATHTFVSYKVDSDGKYEITALTEQKGDYEATAPAITSGSIAAKLEFAAGQPKANNKTLFVIAKGNDDDGYEYSVVTGYANVPAIDSTGFTKGMINQEKDASVAKYVYLVATAFADDKPDGYIFFTSTDYKSDSDGNRTYSIVNAAGEEDTLLVSSSATGDTIAVNWFSIDSISDGVVTKVSAVTAKTGTLSAIGDGALTVGSDAYTYDSATVCVVVDVKADGSYDTVGSFSADSFKLESDYFTYAASVIGDVDGDPVDYIYVTRKAK